MAKALTSRFVVGAAQLGLKYGIANRTGKPNAEQTKRILAVAWRGGSRIIDTAQAYGDSETAIRVALDALPKCRFSIITKLSPSLDIGTEASISTALDASFRALGRKPMAILLHNARWLKHWDGPLGEVLRTAKEKGLVEGLGVSVYEPWEFAAAIDNADMEYIQAPFNVFDRKLETTGLLEKARKEGRKVYLRSLFLQGLLTMDLEQVPSSLEFAKPLLLQWHSICNTWGLSRQEVAVRLVRDAAADAKLVIGCETESQVIENQNYCLRAPLPPALLEALRAVPTGPDALINPSKWS